MRKFAALSALLGLLLGTTLVLAQNPTSPATVLNDIIALLPTNDRGGITAKVLRGVLIEMLSNIAAHTATNADLAALPAQTLPVVRNGFYTAGDGGLALYNYSSAACTAADNGAQVTAVTGGCWIADLSSFGAVSVKLWGAKGDSTGVAGNGTDDTVALNAATTWSTLTGRRVDLTASSGMYRATAPVNLPRHTVIEGDYCAPYTSTAGPYSPGKGSILFFDHLGRGIVAGTGTAPSEGMVVRDICTYRAQPNPTAGTWTPIAADYDIELLQDDLLLQHVMLINPTKGVELTTGRLRIDGLEGQPAQVGIHVISALDTPNITNVHWWPYGTGASSSDPAVTTYRLANFVSAKFDRADNVLMSNYFSIEQKYCIQFSSHSGDANPNLNGVVNKFHGQNIDCDAIGVGGAGLYVDSTSIGSAFQITNFTTQGTGSGSPTGGPSIDIEATARGEITNWRCTLTEGSCATVNGSGTILNITNAGLESFAQGAPNTAAAIAVGANARVNIVGGLQVAGLFGGLNAVPIFSGAGYGWREPVPDTYGLDTASYLFFTAPGSGPITITDLSGGTASCVAAGGTTYCTPDDEIKAIAAGTDAAAAIGTPAGTISLYYSTTNNCYAIYSNFGSTRSLAVARNIIRLTN